MADTAIAGIISAIIINARSVEHNCALKLIARRYLNNFVYEYC